MTAPVTEPAEVEAAEPQMRTLRTIVVPPSTELDIAPLYVEWGNAGAVPGDDDSAPTVVRSEESHSDDFIDESSTKVRSGVSLSFGTYFNAFPASYWQRWTTLTSVRLHAELSGSGSLIVYRSNARGNPQRVSSHDVDGETTLDIDLPLNTFGDGGWYWFDLIGGRGSLTLRRAEWQGEDNGKPQAKVTLQITTMNKPDYCIRNLALLGASPSALDAVSEVLIVDQGTKKVQDEPDFEEVAATLQGKLRIINQANLGGSGGFTRGMYEAVQSEHDYVLLMDDDILLEPVSIPRLVTFAEYCKTPTLVGGHMFDLYNRTTLHTFGEVVNPWTFQPDQPLPDQRLGHDFRWSNLRATPWLHRRVDADYNGWWMTLIPTKVIREIGMSLPVFIKWDDAEYGLRAKQAGYHTVTMPGAAVWHVSWVDKDDLVGWQAYFHIRNRIIAALLHSPYARGGKLLTQSNQSDLKHLFSMQYYTEEGRIKALEDVLAGPDQLHEIQPLRIQEIRAMAKNYPDGQTKPEVDAYPAPKATKPPRRGRPPQPPKPAMLPLWALKTLTKQLVVPVKDAATENPEAHVAHVENKWWRMSQYDSALVTNAEGTGVSWYKRDPKKLREFLPRSVALHARLLAEWPKLREQYQKALPEITSVEAWEKTFEQHTESEIRR